MAKDSRKEFTGKLAANLVPLGELADKTKLKPAISLERKATPTLKPHETRLEVRIPESKKPSDTKIRKRVRSVAVSSHSALIITKKQKVKTTKGEY